MSDVLAVEARSKPSVTRKLNRPGIEKLADVGIVWLLVVLVILVRIDSPGYWSGGNLRAILLAAAVPIVLGVSQLVVILAGNFDISVGSTVGLAAMSVGLVYRNSSNLPPWLGIVIAIGIGAVVGLCNGMLIAYLRVPSIVLTLGSLSVISGITYVVAHGKQVNSDYISDSFIQISKTSPVGIPGIVIIAIVFACVVAVGLRWTRLGRSVYALGSNAEGARMQGLPTRKIEVATFVLSGAAAGLAGAMYLSQYQLVNLFAGSGLGFNAITIVIVGGASVLGGAGSVLRTAISAVLISAMTNGLAVLGLSSFWQATALGALLLLAVALNSRARLLHEARAFIRPELKVL